MLGTLKLLLSCVDLKCEQVHNNNNNNKKQQRMMVHLRLLCLASATWLGVSLLALVGTGAALSGMEGGLRARLRAALRSRDELASRHLWWRALLLLLQTLTLHVSVTSSRHPDLIK